MSVRSDLPERTTSFIKQWNEKTADYPVLALDYTWPSIGTLGLLSSILIGKQEFTPEELELIDVLSWYIGTIVKSVWNDAGLVSELYLDSDRVEVVGKLSAANGTMIRAKLSLIVQVLIQHRPIPLPVLTSYQRDLPVGTDLFSPVMLGVLLCQSSLLEGIEEESDSSPYLALSEKIIKSLSRSTAYYYERCFPDESLGQMAEIYLGGQIYPPLGMNEAWPCINSVSEIIKSLKEFGASQRAIFKFAENLLTFSSEHLSFTGLVLSAAIAAQPMSPKILAHFESKGNFVGFLRPAVIQARELLGIADDWIKSETVSNEHLSAFENEKRLGFLPWLIMDSSILSKRSKDPKITKLLKSILGFDMSGAVGAADSIIDHDPGNLEVRFQRANLHLLAGELQQAELILRMLASEPDAENDPRLYLLWAKIDLALESPNEALRRVAFAISCKKQIQNYQIHFQDIIYGLILTEHSSEALRILESLPESDQSSFSYLINKFRALSNLEANNECNAILNQLADLCPLQSEIFYHRFLK